MLRALVIALLGCILSMHLSTLEAERLRENTDFLEVKASEERDTGSLTSADFKRDSERRGRRHKRSVEGERTSPIRMRDGSVFDVGKVTNYKVLRDDQVVELRNPRSGRLEITIVKASALPEEALNRYDLEYTVIELDELSVTVDKHDEKPRKVKVDWDGNFHYPLIGKIQAKGLTLTQIERKIAKAMREYVRDPQVNISVTKKSPLARILLVGSGFRDYQGHEKILDLMGSGYQTTPENVYDKVCVLRKKRDGSMMCIVVDMEYMFKRYDFSQNIPLKAGDIIHIKRMPPLFGNRFKYWWQQILGWMNEVDEATNALRSIYNWELED
jgi:polysaccharide biosynthesis/export protein